jgi:hypothetical protein
MKESVAHFNRDPNTDFRQIIEFPPHVIFIDNDFVFIFTLQSVTTRCKGHHVEKAAFFGTLPDTRRKHALQIIKVQRFPTM